MNLTNRFSKGVVSAAPLIEPPWWDKEHGREIRKCSSGKRRFLDKVSCEARIELNGKAGKIFAYHCPECDQWHMTSKEQK